MNDEAESSRAAQDRYTPSTSHTTTRQHEDVEDGDHYEEEEDIEEEEDPVEREQRLKQRRLDARRRRIIFLDHLLKEIDLLIFLELIALYHLEYAPPTFYSLKLTLAVAPSSGSRCAPSFTAPSLLRFPTWPSTSSTTNTSLTFR